MIYFDTREQQTESDITNALQICIPAELTSRTKIFFCKWNSDEPDFESTPDNKESIIYVIEGEGSILLADNKIELREGVFVFLPSHLAWKLESSQQKPLKHLLLSIPLFHKPLYSQSPKIVKEIMNGRIYDFGSNSTILVLDRSDTEQCEATVVSWLPHQRGAMVAHNDKEQTFYVLNGTGNVTVKGETQKVTPGDIIFVPYNTPHTTEAGEETLTYLCVNTIYTEKKYASFDEMYHLVVGDRMRRWKEKDDSVGL